MSAAMTELDRMENLLIRASAGSGKTHQLTGRYLALLLRGHAPDGILATTFTRKAAGEILDRVLQRLAKAATSEKDRTALADQLGLPRLAREQCESLCVRLTRELHRLRIGTLDSFFAQVARGCSLEMGLGPDWEIVEELDDARLKREAIDLVLDEEEDAALLTLVNLLAKGETTRGIDNLIRSTIDALYPLYCETTEDAWHTLPDYKPLGDIELAELWEELHAVALNNGMATARGADQVRFLKEAWKEFLSTGLAAKVHDESLTYYGKPIPDEAVALYRRLIDHVRALEVRKVVLQTQATWQLLHKFHAVYSRLKEERGSLRFDDVTRRLAGTAVLNETDQVQFRLDGTLTHLLLDEFQDTSLSQWQVLRPLAQRVAGEAEGSFFCVGDEKQAIYGWRGGIAAIFGAVEAELADIVPRPLDTSYRSHQPVIDTVNRLFAGLSKHDNLDKERSGVERWLGGFLPHRTTFTDGLGYVCLRVTDAPDDETETTAEAQARCAAAYVRGLVAEAPGKSVTILTRSNDNVARLIFALRQLGVAASEEGGNPLVDSAAVQIVCSALQLADHPGDTVARFHLAGSPLGAELGLTESTCREPSGTPGERQRAANENAAEVSLRIRRALVEAGYGPTIARWAAVLRPLCNAREWNRLRQLVDLAYDYEEGATLRATDFCELVRSQRLPDPQAADVRVMTIHQAKGLEFDIVVLPDLESTLVGQTPAVVTRRPAPTAPVDRVCRYANEAVQALMPADVQEMFDAYREQAVSEALCVLYVAVTRPIHALHLLIRPGSDGEKRLPKKFSGLLRAALAPGQPATAGALLFEHGDPRWFEHMTPAAIPTPAALAPSPERQRREASVAERSDARPTKGKARKSTPAAGMLFGPEEDETPVAREEAQPAPEPPFSPVTPTTEIRLAPSRRALRGLARVTPSRLSAHASRSIPFLLGRDTDGGQLRGSVLHKWFEQIGWLDDGLPDLRRLHALGRQIGLSRAHCASLHKTFLETVAQPVIRRWLSRAAYAEATDLPLPSEVCDALRQGRATFRVEREFPLLVRGEDHVLSGSIDRLVLIERADGTLLAADILDFKSDRVDPADPASLPLLRDRYRPQLAAYRTALARMLHLPESHISARLAALAGDSVCEI